VLHIPNVSRTNFACYLALPFDRNEAAIDEDSRLTQNRIFYSYRKQSDFTTSRYEAYRDLFAVFDSEEKEGWLE
jgi:hypothetical protein